MLIFIEPFTWKSKGPSQTLFQEKKRKEKQTNKQTKHPTTTTNNHKELKERKEAFDLSDLKPK